MGLQGLFQPNSEWEESIFGNLDTINNSSPLTFQEALHLLDTKGPNIISASKPPTWISFLFSALVHPFNILLCILALASGVMEDFSTMGIMLFMVFISTAIRFQQEYSSHRAADSLKSLISTKARVMRRERKDQFPQELAISIEQLVPGDWIRLHPGDVIPADVKVHYSRDLYISQASLTGEAIPVEKFPLESDNYQTLKPILTIPHINIPIESSAESKTTTGINFIHSSLGQFQPKRKTNKARRFFRSLFGLPVDLHSSNSNEQTSVNLDLPNFCYMGTSVVTGSATCIVLNTGNATYFGRMAKQLEIRNPPNAFQLGVRRISWIFFLTMFCLVPPVLLLQGFLNKNWPAALLFSLSVAVGLTPEMLPMIVNTALAKGTVQMSKKKCIVKNLDAIVNMGGIDVLCTDKTGTLTKSIVVLTKHIDQSGKESRVPLRLAYLNANFQQTLSNPMDDAVNNFYASQNLESKLLASHASIFDGKDEPETSTFSVSDLSKQFIYLNEAPFDFIRRRVSVFLKPTDESILELIMICKGAVEETLSICSKIFVDDGQEKDKEVLPDESKVTALNSVVVSQLQTISDDLSEEGFRVIAVAYKRLPINSTLLDASLEEEMTFAGFLAFLDPPKESTKDAIERVRQLNIEVKVLTGDSPSICKKICEEIGLPIKSIITAADLEGASDERISLLARDGTIFAKLTPSQKADIIRALKRNENIVGFLGDGINDSLALSEADVGISVDTGTDIAKDSANIILLEKNIGVITDGIIVGRTTYGNTIKYILMAISSNFGNVFSLLVASSWLPFLPMLPIQMLVQNLLYDISQIAIPWDNIDKEFQAIPHRWSMRNVLRFMVMLGPWSSVFDITTFLFMYYAFDIKTITDNVPLFQTTWFTVGLLTQTLIIHMIRTSKWPFFQSWASRPVVMMTVVIMCVGLALPYVPYVNTWIGLVTLDPLVYPFVVGVLITYCLIAQMAKTFYIRIFKEWF